MNDDVLAQVSDAPTSNRNFEGRWAVAGARTW
jgi:homoaconitase/3-isopropylmalate dehydratase large subunit